MSAALDLTDFKNPVWRICNIYSIVDKDGKVIPFRPNWGQLQLLEEQRNRHLVLKARQLGLSTLIGIIQLDLCLWTDQKTAMTIAHDRDSLEKMFSRNIKGVYDRLPEGIRSMVPAQRDRAHQMKFDNGSDISVSLSARSTTVQFLHVSEFGKICAKYPDKAKEIVTGAFEAVPADGVIIIESTAEGASGYFHDYCMEAHKRQQENREPASHEWSMTFLPWWRHPEYVASPKGVQLPHKLMQYFTELEGKIGKKLGPARKAWYALKAKTLGDDLKREYPATVEEAFQRSLEGAFYAEQMARARKEGRITRVPHETGVEVETWWDLGVDDATVIWFMQQVGREYRAIDYYEASGEGLQHFAKVIKEKAAEHGYIYGDHIAPHDIKVREWSGDARTRLEVADNLGIKFTVCPQHAVADGIEAVRNAIDKTWFDKEHCKQGINALDAYRKEWDETRGTYRTKPLHDHSSHGADGFRTGVMGRNRRRGTQARPVAASTKLSAF